MLDSILDDLSHERVEINFVEFSGPAFPGVDNRLIALHLLREGFTLATDLRRRRAGHAGGRTHLQSAAAHPARRLSASDQTHPGDDDAGEDRRVFFRAGREPVELFEISLHDLRRRQKIRLEDFLLRVDFLRALGKTVLLSGVGPYHLLPAFLRRYTSGRIAFLMGLPSLREIFATKHYEKLPGGLLQGMGQLFNEDVRLAIYPVWSGGRLLGLDDFRPPKDHALLYQQLRESVSSCRFHTLPRPKPRRCRIRCWR